MEDVWHPVLSPQNSSKPPVVDTLWYNDDDNEDG